MSDHLPECPCANKSAHPDGCLCCEVSSPCICDRLRACEQRIEEAMDRAWTQTVQLAEAHARVSAHRAALDAAREAVQAELGWEEADPSDDFNPHTVIWKFRALAAIDALRGES